MKLPRRCSHLIWLLLLLNYCVGDISLSGEQPVSVWCDEIVLNLIVSKLSEMNTKIDLLDRKLTDSTNSNNNSPNIEKLVADSVKEFQTQTKLESLSQIVSNFNRTIHEEITNQAEAQRIQIEKLTNTFSAQHLEALELNVKTSSQHNAETLAASSAKLEADIENLTRLLNESRNQLNKIEAQIQQELKSEHNVESTHANPAIPTMPSHYSNYEEDNKRILALLNTNNNALLSTQQQFKQNFANFDAVSNRVINMQENRFTNIENSQKSMVDKLNAIVGNLKDSVLPFTSRMKDGYSDYISAFPSCEKGVQTVGKTGVYRLYMPNIGLPPFNAYCFRDPDGGKSYTVIQQRWKGSLSFNRDWYSYKHGFGNLSDDHWLGLEKVYAMTSKQKYEIRIDLVDHKNQLLYVKYNYFEIGNEDHKYYLKAVGLYNGTAVDIFKGTFSSLDGGYGNLNSARNLNSDAWHGWISAFKQTRMAIRPVV